MNGTLLLSNGSRFGKSIIFGVDMSSSLHLDNKREDISFLGKCSTQGLDNKTK